MRLNSNTICLIRIVCAFLCHFSAQQSFASGNICAQLFIKNPSASSQISPLETIIDTLSATQNDFPNTGDVLFNHGLPHERRIYSANFETIIRDNKLHITFIGPESASNRGFPSELSSRTNPTSEEYSRLGITYEVSGTDFRWYVPSISTVNWLLINKLEISPNIVSVVGVLHNHNDSYGLLPIEVVWRHMANRQLVVVTGKSNLLENTFHDLVDHIPGYLLLIERYPELWLRATAAMNRSFQWLDKEHPAFKGKLVDIERQYGVAQREKIVGLYFAIKEITYWFEYLTPMLNRDSLENQFNHQDTRPISDIEQAIITLENKVLALKQ